MQDKSLNLNQKNEQKNPNDPGPIFSSRRYDEDT